jgi:ATP-dependent protease HslVU (ClpYQ) peptidase subunit
MTCIIGLSVDGEAFIAADSCGTVDDNLCLVGDSKIFNVGEYLIGIAGTRRPAEVIRYRLSAPAIPTDATPADLDRILATDFADALRAALRDAGALSKDADKGDIFDASGIVVVRGRVYFLAGNFSVTPVRDGIWSTGSGSAYALGSLRSTTGKASRERIETALEVAVYYSDGVRPPFHILPE